MNEPIRRKPRSMRSKIFSTLFILLVYGGFILSLFFWTWEYFIGGLFFALILSVWMGEDDG